MIMRFMKIFTNYRLLNSTVVCTTHARTYIKHTCIHPPMRCKWTLVSPLHLWYNFCGCKNISGDDDLYLWNGLCILESLSPSALSCLFSFWIVRKILYYTLHCETAMVCLVEFLKVLLRYFQMVCQKRIFSYVSASHMISSLWYKFKWWHSFFIDPKTTKKRCPRWKNIEKGKKEILASSNGKQQKCTHQELKSKTNKHFDMHFSTCCYSCPIMEFDWYWTATILIVWMRILLLSSRFYEELME